jgi:hypothetical protein
MKKKNNTLYKNNLGDIIEFNTHNTGTIILSESENFKQGHFETGLISLSKDDYWKRIVSESEFKEIETNGQKVFDKEFKDKIFFYFIKKQQTISINNINEIEQLSLYLDTHKDSDICVIINHSIYGEYLELIKNNEKLKKTSILTTIINKENNEIQEIEYIDIDRIIFKLRPMQTNLFYFKIPENILKDVINNNTNHINLLESKENNKNNESLKKQNKRI